MTITTKRPASSGATWDEAPKNSPRLRVVKDPIEEINREFAIIKTGGILCQQGEEDKFISVSQFRNWLANREMTATEWLAHPNRREYNSVVFRPGETTPNDYNLWRGYGCEPNKRGSCDYFLDHVQHNVCKGNEDHFRWVMSFFAEIVQKPMQKSGVSLVIRGTSGGGKTIVGQVIGSLFPKHYRLVDNPDQVTGKFNAHMSSLLMLHADEAFFAGDPRNAGKLRSMITRDEHIIEPKGLDSFRVPNHMRLFITSEESWVVPASLHERRFAIFGISNSSVGDRSFFKSMMDELDNGGRERLLYELMHFDMVDLRELPQTKELRDNKTHSLNKDQAWWVRCLERGTILGGKWENIVDREAVLRVYCEEVRDRNAGKSTQTSLGILLSEMVPDLGKPRGFYRLPDLEECIAHFEGRTKMKIARPRR